MRAEIRGAVVRFDGFEHLYYIWLTINRQMLKELDHEKSYRTRIYDP